MISWKTLVELDEVLKAKLARTKDTKKRADLQGMIDEVRAERIRVSEIELTTMLNEFKKYQKGN